MHIQDPSTAKKLVPHWGYADRVSPCVNDASTCAYLDSIYRSHDLSMIYTFSLWAIIAGIIFIWAIFRFSTRFFKKKSEIVIEVDGQRKPTSNGIISRVIRTSYTYFRRHLYPEFPGSTFGYASRLQVLIFAILTAYVILFSLIGITYMSWETPHKDNPSIIDTRTGFSGFADRVGVFAFTLTPLAVFLSTRESMLTLITGLSYQHFNFLHRWTGRLVFAQASMHTLGWMIIKGCLYQPQPSAFNAFIIQPYIIWGISAMTVLIFIYIFSIKSVIRWTGYEFFLISHLLAAILFIVTCWQHWPNLGCWMIASLTIILLDYALRFLHFILIHVKLVGNRKGFVAADAKISSFDDPNGKIIRLDFNFAHGPWQPGQHYFLTFPALSIWQSHPFTVLSSPSPESSIQNHSYIIRCRTGETAKLGQLANTTKTTSILLKGPYGTQNLWRRSSNILSISGGTGISFTLPILHEAALRSGNGFLQLVWIIRRPENFSWASAELETLQALHFVHIRVIITSNCKEIGTDEDSDLLAQAEKKTLRTAEVNANNDKLPNLLSRKRMEVSYMNGRPSMRDIISNYLNQVESEKILVIGSGPPQMGIDARSAVASFNCPDKVWRGDKKGDVDFYWDY